MLKVELYALNKYMQGFFIDLNHTMSTMLQSIWSE